MQFEQTFFLTLFFWLNYFLLQLLSFLGVGFGGIFLDTIFFMLASLCKNVYALETCSFASISSAACLCVTVCIIKDSSSRGCVIGLFMPSRL